jgi:hypothetical protein
MKVFIIKKEVENEYGIAKVSDSLVAEFELLHKDKIVVEGSSIQDAILKFAAMDKPADVPFNAALQKVKQRQ